MRTGFEDKPWWVAALLGLVLGGLIYGVCFHFLLKPKNEELAGLERELQVLQQKIQEGLAAKAQLPRFREEVRALELELDKLLRILPARRNTPQLLRRIRTLTEQGDFDLKRFAPGNFIDQDFYSEWPISISLEGSYHNLALFFDRISRFSRIINIEGLTVSAVKGANPLRSIAANFNAKTFIYKEPPPPETTGQEAQ